TVGRESPRGPVRPRTTRGHHRWCRALAELAALTAELAYCEGIAVSTKHFAFSKLPVFSTKVTERFKINPDPIGKDARAIMSNTAWIDFITTDDRCGGVHFQARGMVVRVYFDSDWTASTIPPPPTLFRGWGGGGARPRLLFARAQVVESGGGKIMLFHSRLYWRPGGFAFFPSRRGAQQFAVRPLQLAS